MASANAPLDEQLEWFETTEVEPHEKTREEERASVLVARILYCPCCQWEESEAAGVCYRCGSALSHDPSHDPLLQRLGLASLSPTLTLVSQPQQVPRRVQPRRR